MDANREPKPGKPKGLKKPGQKIIIIDTPFDLWHIQTVQSPCMVFINYSILLLNRFNRQMHRILIIIGVTLLVSGLAWPIVDKLALGRLPGDIIINKPNVKLYFPITTMIIVSSVISLVMWIFKK